MYLDKKINIIVAVADNGVIGNKGELPWEIPEDIERFQRLTMGQSVIMGRKTLQSIGKPLDRRQNIILTKKGAAAIEGVELGGEIIWLAPYNPMSGATDSMRCAIGMAKHEVFVIGGQKVYKEALKFADTVYLTRVHRHVAGDRFFHFDAEGWSVAEEEKHDGFTFFTYTRS